MSSRTATAFLLLVGADIIGRQPFADQERVRVLFQQFRIQLGGLLVIPAVGVGVGQPQFDVRITRVEGERLLVALLDSLSVDLLPPRRFWRNTTE
jgi:hypothetical protein